MTIKLNEDERVFLISMVTESVEFYMKKVKDIEKTLLEIPEEHEDQKLEFERIREWHMKRFNSICHIRQQLKA